MPAPAESLRGRRVIVTRPAHQAAPLCAALERAGAVAVPLPLLHVVPNTLGSHDLVPDAHAYDWVLFTSANGVAHAQAALGPLGDALRGHEGVAAVGPATAAALAAQGVTVRLVAPEHVAESLADALGDVDGRRVLWPRAADARDVLASRLRARGADVREIVVYRTVPAPLPADAADRVRSAHAVTFASPSAVRSFVASLGTTPLGTSADAVRVACIGPVTEAAARTLGVRVDAVASSYTDAGLVHALGRALA